MNNLQAIAIMAAILWSAGGVDYAEAVANAKEIFAEAAK